MALFGGNTQHGTAPNDGATQQEQQESTVDEGDQSYFDAFEGQGTDSIGQDAVSTPYLSMVQPGSTASMSHNPGIWINSSTQEEYGSSVEVITLAFKTVWTERDKEPPYMTVGRYEPNSIEVNIEKPKPGQRGFPKMINPLTGNKVEELFIYALMLADKPETGVLYFSPTAGSMRACKAWNGLLRSMRLPTGKLAPIFAFSWTLDLDLVQNPARNNPNEKIAKFVKASVAHIVAKNLFFTMVQPQIAAANDITMLAAPEASGDIDTSN
jgi:hypothetical protein